MKRILLILILILMPLQSIAGIVDPLEYNGNDWKVWDGNRKSNYITGFMVGSGYVIAKNQFYPSNLLLVNISSDQIIDGLNILYRDFRNRNILLVDAVYVIKKQITGSSPEDIERILLYLRSDRKEDGHLRIKDEKGKTIRIISFP